MARRSRKSADAEGLDYLYHTARRIHRLADDNVTADAATQQRVRAGINTLFSSPQAEADDGPPPATLAQSVVSSVAVRVAAGMIVTFGGKPMVDSLGRMVSTASRKRRGSAAAE